MDSHTLQIDLEDENLDAGSMVYVADANTAIDPGLKVPGWNVQMVAPTVGQHEYLTNYGLQSRGKSRRSIRAPNSRSSCCALTLARCSSSSGCRPCRSCWA